MARAYVLVTVPGGRGDSCARMIRSSNGSLRIAQVTSSEDARIATGLTEEFGAWAKGIARERYGIDVDVAGEHLGSSVDGLLPPDGRLYLAFLGGSAVGVGGLKLLAPDTAELKRLYVQPHVRGRGVGRALVERVLRDARALSVRAVHLETAVFMEAAVAVYRSFGFVEEPPYAGRELEHVPGMERIVKYMSLSLQPR